MMREIVEKANNTLRTYLKNTRNAVFLVEVNDNFARSCVLDILREEFAFEIVDFEFVKNDFVHFLRSYISMEKDRHICVWNFSENFEAYDIIKSLNISREILKDIGLVVFVMPTFLVREIDERELNLRDYILRKFSYVEHRRLPFEPMYIFPFMLERSYRSQKAVDTVWLERQITSDIDLRDKIQLYYDLLNIYLRRRLSKYDFILLKDTFEILCEGQALHGNSSLNEEDSVNELYRTRTEIIYRTAEVFALQKYYEEAEKVFRKLIELLAGSGEARWIEAKEGLACCLYYQAKYMQAIEVLLKLYDNMEEKKPINDAWKMRILNNYGACLYKLGEYEQAYECWNVCKDTLQAVNLLDERRWARCVYNQMLAELEFREPSLEKVEEYMRLYPQIKASLGETSMFYVQHSLLRIWILGVCYGKNCQALQLGRDLLNWEREIFEGNHYCIALSHYINYILYMQMGDEIQAMTCLEKCKNILKNNILTNESLPDIIGASAI